MNKKIKVLIAAVVVLFLGLGIYTFASPNDEEDLLTPQTEQKAKKVDDKDIDVTPQEETKEETEEEDNEQVINVPGQNQNQNQGGQQNNPGQTLPEQEGEEEAVQQEQQAAQEEVKEVDTTAPKLEVTYSETNWTNENVTVTIKSNEELQKLDGWDLAKDKLSMTLVVPSNVETTKVTVSDLAGNTAEVEYKVTNIDKQAPIVKVTYNQKASLTDPTNGDVIIRFIANEEIQPVEGYAHVQDGTILRKTLKANDSGTLTITDLAGNTAEVDYEVTNIDKQAPIVKVTYNQKASLTDPTNGDVIIRFIANEEIQPVEGYAHVQDGTILRKTLKANDSGTLTITDLAGNTTNVEYSVTVIDKTKPVLSISYDVTTPTNGSVTATITSNEAVTIDGWTKVNDKTFTKVTADNVELTKITATDLAGNTAEVDYEVTNIDKQAPIVKVTYNQKASLIDPTNGDVIIRFIANEEIQPVEGYAHVQDGTILRKTLKANDSGTLTITDLAGNTTNVEYSVTVIDKEKPEITVLDTSVGTDNIYSKIDLEFADNDVIKEVTVNNTEVKLTEGKLNFADGLYAEGSNTVKVTDRAGNSEKIEFTIDITKPTSTITDKSYHKGDVNYEIVEANFYYANVYLNHATKTTKYTKEFKLTEEGTYQLDIFDKAGNKTTKWVVIDKHLPEITASSKYTNENVTLTITDKYLLTVTINDKTYTRDNMKAKANNEDWTFTKELNEAGTYKITAVDKTGYESTETVVIDREGPVPTKVQVDGGKSIKSVVDDKKVYTHFYKEDSSLIFTVEFDEELSANPILTINDVSFGEMTLVKNTTYTYTKSVKPNGNIKIADGVVVYEITGYKDSLGNEGKKLTIDDATEPVLKNAVVDTTAPSIEVIKNNAYSNKDVTLTITDTNLSKVTVDNEEVTLNEKNEITLSNEKPYTVVATDKAGNTTTKTFTIDKKFDGIHHSNLQAGKEVEPNVFYAKENDTIYMAIKFNEAINDENVAFKLVQGDKKITLTDVTKQVEEDGVYYYKYYKITKDEFEDGEVKMLVTGIEDLAGNTHKDVNAPSNSRRVFLDMTAPTVTDVKLTKNVSGKTNIELTFSEDIVLFNDKEVSGNKVTLTNIKNNTYNYTFTDATGNVGSYELEVKVDELANVYTINSESDLVNLANYINSGETRFANSTIKLNTDVKLRKEWNPMFATKATMDKVVIDGNGHTITHLFTLRETPEKMDGTLEKQYGNGFIGDIKDGVNVTITNIKFDNATITDPSGTGNDGTISQHYAGVVVGHNDGNLTIENVTVTNAKVNNSWQTGGLVGYSSKNLTFTDCTIKDSYIGGIQATAGTLFGLGKANITVNNSHAENVTLYTDGLTFASTQAKEDNYYVGHLYEYELTVDNLSSEKDIVIGVKTEKELLNTLNSGSANSKETIKLLDNIVLTEKLLINENTDIILDLNKKSITAYNVATKRIESYGKVVLTNGKILGGTEYDSNVSNGTAMIKLFNDAELTIESNASVAGGYSVVWPTANSKLVVKGAITSEGGAAVITNGTYIIGATITIEDGATLTSKNATAIYLPSGNLIVNGGKITGYSGIGIKGGTAIINGGEIKATGAQVAFEHEGSGWVDTGDALAVENSSYPAAPPKVTINGGKFISKYGKAIVSYVESDKFDPITGYVKGGQFNKEIDSSYIASGYTQVEDNELATKVVAE